MIKLNINLGLPFVEDLSFFNLPVLFEIVN